MDLEERAKIIWQQYEKGVEYQNNSGLSKIIPQCVSFYEGNQWGNVSEKTKNLPRPVVNITKMIVRSKKAGILSQKTQFVYTCKDAEKSKMFNNFATFITKELNQDKMDKMAISDGGKKGTYIYHYYWDSDAKGRLGNLPGGVRCEIIDPLNIFVENPTNRDEQSQKWIIIRSRLNVETAKAMADDGVNKELIASDDNESKYNEQEQDKDSKCTVLTRYFRIKGEVYFEKAVQGTIIVKARPLHPNINSIYKDDTKEDLANEEGYELNELNSDVKAHLYPIAIGSYEERDKSIFGIGEIEGIIPNQKAINFNIAIQLLNVQNVWGGKYVVHPNALRGQKITNDPGQVIVDYSNTMQGVKKLTEQISNDIPIRLSDSLMGLTRAVTGATEVMTGETIGANTSGAAILQLQSQAIKPIEDLQQSFWNTKVKCGKILEMFYKLFYENTTYYYKERNEQGLETGESLEAVFNGSDFKDVDFDVTVDVVAGAKGSEISLVQALDNLLQQKQIDLKTYFELYPHNALPNKNEIIQKINDLQVSENNQLKQQVQQMQIQLENASNTIKEDKQTIQNALNSIREVENLKKIIINLQNEYSNKIMEANRQIAQGNATIKETTGDAQILARALNRKNLDNQEQ